MTTSQLEQLLTPDNRKKIYQERVTYLDASLAAVIREKAETIPLEQFSLYQDPERLQRLAGGDEMPAELEFSFEMNDVQVTVSSRPSKDFVRFSYRSQEGEHEAQFLISNHVQSNTIYEIAQRRIREDRDAFKQRMDEQRGMLARRALFSHAKFDSAPLPKTTGEPPAPVSEEPLAEKSAEYRPV